MGGKTGTTTSKVTIPPEVLARYNSVNTQAQNVAATPFQQYSTDPNAFVAPLNSTQQAGVAGANAAAGLAQPYYQAATGAMGAGLSAAVPFAYGSGAAVNPSDINGGVINKYMSPYLGTVLGTTLAAENQQNAQQRSQMQGNAISAGAYGGDRANVGLANLAYQQGLANNQTNANILNTGYGQALSTAQQQQGVDLSAQQANRAALGQAGQSLYNEFTGYGQGLAGLGTGAQTAAEQGAQGQLAAGQVGQQTQQAGLSALYNQFLQQQSYPFQVAQFLANIAEGTGALSGSTTSTTQPTPFFSDERLKEGIEPIGRTYDGQKIVKFRYRGKPETHIGLLAQDVEKHHPEAVGQSQGYKTVDYDAATEESAKKYAGGVVNLDEYRKHYLGGGLVGADALKAILAQQAQMYGALPFAANGTYGGPMSSNPRGGATGIVPAASLHVPALTVAKGPSTAPQSGLSQLAGLASTINTGKSLGESAESLANAADRGVDWVRGRMGISASNPQNQTDTSFPTPPVPPDYTPEARGGVVPFRRPRADGGFDPADPNADSTPEDIYKPKMGLNIPQEDPHAKLATANAPPGSSSQIGGLGSTLKDAASIVGAAKTLGSAAGGIGSWIGDTVLPFLALKDGGVVPRHGYASDGTVEDLPLPPVPPDYAAPDQPTGISPRRVDAFERAVNRTLGFEGGYNPADSNGYPVNFGINQKANPDVNVRNLTQDDARNIYRTRYWNAINGDDLAAQNPDLAHVAFDTATLAGPGRAKELLAQANGDPNKLLDLRQQFQDGLVQSDPKQYGPYANNWRRRVEALRNDIGGASAAASVPTGGVAPPAATDATDGGNLYATGDASSGSQGGYGNMRVDQRAAREPGWMERNRDWVLPALGFLGSAASSNSRYLGAALLQGAAGAAQGINQASNLELAQQGRDIGAAAQNTSASNTGLEQQRVQALIARGTAEAMKLGFVPVIRNGRYVTMPADQFVRAVRAGEDLQIAPSNLPNIPTSGAQSPAGAATGTPAVPNVPIAPSEAPAPSTTPTPGVPSTAAVSNNPATPLWRALTPDVANRAVQAAQGAIATGHWDGSATPTAVQNPFDDIEARRISANQNQTNRISQMGALAEAAATGGQGPFGATVAKPMLDMANSLIGFYGGKTADQLFDPAKYGAMTEAQKLSTLMAANSQMANQSRAWQEMAAFLQATPNPAQDVNGMRRVMSGVMVEMQRAKDLGDFAQNWRDTVQSATGNPGIYKYTGNGMENTFQERHADQYEKDKNALIKIMEAGARVPNASAPNGVSTVPLATYIAQNGISPALKAQLSKQYGPEILRYFGVQPNG